MKYKFVAMGTVSEGHLRPDVRWMHSFIGILRYDEELSPYTLDMQKKRAPEYECMCFAIGDAIDLIVLYDWITQIWQLEIEGTPSLELETDGWCVEITSTVARFKSLWDDAFAEVPLADFKFCLLSYIQFLKDPKKGTIERPMPNYG